MDGDVLQHDILLDRIDQQQFMGGQNNLGAENSNMTRFGYNFNKSLDTSSQNQNNQQFSVCSEEKTEFLKKKGRVQIISLVLIKDFLEQGTDCSQNKSIHIRPESIKQEIKNFLESNSFYFEQQQECDQGEVSIDFQGVKGGEKKYYSFPVVIRQQKSMQVEQEFLLAEQAEDFDLDINYTQSRGIFYLETSVKNAEILFRQLCEQKRRCQQETDIFELEFKFYPIWDEQKHREDIFQNDYLKKNFQILKKPDQNQKGSFGGVHTCLSITNKNIYAVKIVAPESANMFYEQTARIEDLKLFREIPIAMSLTHKNVVTTHNWWIEKKVPCFCCQEQNVPFYIVIQMEFVGDFTKSSLTLTDYLPQLHKMETLKRRVQSYDIFDQIWNGLAYMRTQEAVHRDLKPSNIFCEWRQGRMQVKIGDFGFSKIMYNNAQEFSGENSELNTQILRPIDKKRSMIHQQKYYGKNRGIYYPPETEEDDEYDCFSDLWVLGCFLLDMLNVKARGETTKNYREDSQYFLKYDEILPDKFETLYPVESRVIKILTIKDTETRKKNIIHPNFSKLLFEYQTEINKLNNQNNYQ